MVQNICAELDLHNIHYHDTNSLATILLQVDAGLGFAVVPGKLSGMIHGNVAFIPLRGKIILPCLALGLAPFIMQSTESLIAVCFNSSLLKYGGDIAVGAFGVVNRLAIFIVMIVIGLNHGMQPIAGFNYGAKHYDRILEVLKLSVWVATIITTIGFIVGTFFAEPCVVLFAKDSPELIAAAAHGLSIYVMFFPFIGMQIVSTAFFQSIGHAGKSIFLSLTRQMLFLLPAILILPVFMDNKVDGVYTKTQEPHGFVSNFSATGVWKNLYIEARLRLKDKFELWLFRDMIPVPAVHLMSELRAKSVL